MLDQEPIKPVSITHEEYQSKKAGIELMEILYEADDDVKLGYVAPIEDTFNGLRMLLKG